MGKLGKSKLGKFTSKKPKKDPKILAKLQL